MNWTSFLAHPCRRRRVPRAALRLCAAGLLLVQTLLSAEAARPASRPAPTTRPAHTPRAPSPPNPGSAATTRRTTPRPASRPARPVSGARRPTPGAIYRAAKAASVIVLRDGHLMGSGFFVDSSGLLITCAHVAHGKGHALEIASPTLGRLAVKRLAVDLGHDLALLRAPARKTPYPALTLARAVPAPGEPAYLFGTPEFRHALMLKAHMASEANRYCYDPGVGCYVGAVYLAGASPRGTSGGCWLSARGEVIGVQLGYLNTAKSPAGIAFAAPVTAVASLVKARASTRVPTLGTRLDELWTQAPGYIRRFPPHATGIITVVPVKGGPVDRVGLTKESLIIAVDEEPVTYRDDLLALIRRRQVGEVLMLRVRDPDGKKPRIVAIKLGRVTESGAGK